MVYGTDWRWILIVPVLWLVFMSIEMIKVSASFILDTSTLLMGFIYTVLPFTLLVYFSQVNGSFDARLPFGFFLNLWANDTGA